MIADKTGTIEVGKEADLIAVTNNPLKNITSFSRNKNKCKDNKSF